MCLRLWCVCMCVVVRGEQNWDIWDAHGTPRGPSGSSFSEPQNRDSCASKKQKLKVTAGLSSTSLQLQLRLHTVTDMS